MDSFVRDTYLHELETQCRFALNAVEHLNTALSRVAQGASPREQRSAHAEVFRAIHSFLTHASNVSKLLWPAPPRRQREEKRIARADELRSVLGLPEDGHPLKSRTVRDHLEHFDERLDEWAETGSSRHYVQDCIGPRDALAWISPADTMRWFDPSTNHFIFRGDDVDLQALASAVSELLPVVWLAFSDPHNALFRLREEYPDTLFSWDDFRSDVFRLVIEDPRLHVSDVKSIHFHPYGSTADIDFGSGDEAHQFSMELPRVQLPGPKTQASIVADAIVREILSRKQFSDRTEPQPVVDKNGQGDARGIALLVLRGHRLFRLIGKTLRSVFRRWVAR